MEILLYIAFFIFGTVIGSFLNVLIYRLPRGKSPLKPVFSFCPECGTNIKWYDNIPVVSYILLKGRCRNCGHRISIRYLIVEIITGVASVLSYLKWGLSIDYLFIFIFLCVIIAITFIDIDFKIIPDELNLSGFLTGIVYTFFRGDFTVLDGFSGAVVGAGFLWAVAYLYMKFRGIEGLGMGDVKMMAFVGMYAGWFGALFTIFVGSFLGALIGGLSAYLLKALKTKWEI
ncbi:MAG: prepilin peptidase [Persephonella sp.]|nr:prepilin peptidase [Persephonella sp.]